MVTKELIDYIEDHTILTVGDDLFWGVYPKDDRVGVLISDLGGVHNDTDMGIMQILINARYQDYQTTMLNIGLVYDLLAYSNGLTLPSYKVFNTIPVSMPQFLGTDTTGLLMFSAIINLFTEV